MNDAYYTCAFLVFIFLNFLVFIFLVFHVLFCCLYTFPLLTHHSGAEVREPVGPIHFGGTERATTWMGYMEGAVQGGEQVAAHVVAELLGAAAAKDVFKAASPHVTVKALPLRMGAIERRLPSVPTFWSVIYVCAAVIVVTIAILVLLLLSRADQ